MKKGAGISQRTYVKDPWTWTVVWGLAMEVGGGLYGGGKMGEIETTVVPQAIKYFKKRIENDNVKARYI